MDMHQLQREASAYHEAGHAVVACYYDWWINGEGVEIDSRQHCGLTCYVKDNTVEAGISVSLAGWLSEYKFHGRGGFRTDDDLAWVIANIGDEEGGDDSDVLTRLIEANPEADEDCLISLYRQHQERTMAIINNPSQWGSIERLAAALLLKGKLSGEEASELIAEATWARRSER